MNTMQILILLGAFTAIGLIFFAGYRSGHQDGHDTGFSEGQDGGRQANAAYIHSLKADIGTLNSRVTAQARQLHEAADDYLELSRQHRQLRTQHPLSNEDRTTLMSVASKLQLAAETFAAFPTAQQHAAAAIQLREKVLVMAARLAPTPDTAESYQLAGASAWERADTAYCGDQPAMCM